jgi:multicomponent K+:H+ antiporter subunit E
MLAGSLSLGQVLLGALLAVVIPWFTPRRRAGRLRRRGLLAVPRLAAVVLGDIVVANVDVARRIFGPEAAIRSAWVDVPVALRDPRGLWMLASIVSMTPGTLTAALGADGATLRVHALHLDGEAALVAEIKSRYEAPLKELFEA